MPKFLFLDKVDSTMEYVKRNLNSLENGDVVWTTEQTAGKGSRDRTFFSPKEGLYFSLLLNPVDESVFKYITPLVSVAARSAVIKVFNTDTRIKWVNDLYLNGKKVCGILCERILNAVIIGVGFNIAPPKNGFPDDIKTKAGTICSSEQSPERKTELLNAFYNEFFALSNTKREIVMDMYKNFSLVIGKNITVETSAGTLNGIAADFNEYGHLILKTDNSFSVISSGTLTDFKN